MHLAAVAAIGHVTYKALVPSVTNAQQVLAVEVMM